MIILVIVAGIVIVQLTDENGVLRKVEQANLESKKAQYFEEIQIEAFAEQTEWVETPKTGTTFIESLGTRIVANRDWATSYAPEDENTLVIKTIEGYEIPITVDNIKYTASIDKGDFSTESRKATISFNSNNGSGTMASVEIVKGTNYTIPQNAFSKEGYVFSGWKDANNNSYNDKATIQNVTKSIELTAQWELLTHRAGQEITVTVGTGASAFTEHFYILYDSKESESKVKVLAKYCLSTSELKQQNASYETTACAFSSSQYWSGTSVNLNNVNSTAATVMNKARDYAVVIGMERQDGGLLTQSEAYTLLNKMPEIIKPSSLYYWLGTTYYQYVRDVCGWSNSFGTGEYSNKRSIRPVINLSKSLID